MNQSRNLVVVRCGDRSLHAGWVALPRNWDLAISYFGDDALKLFPEADVVHRYKGGKWDGLHDFFVHHPNLIDRYDYFWLPDDDIEADCASIDALFACVKQNDFELAQPSLSPRSFLSHLVSAWNPLFEYRNVNLVEIMVPVLRRDLLRHVLPLFQTSKTGFGMDFIWHRFTSDPANRVAVIDKVQVTHTRAVGGALRQMLVREGGETAEQEEARFLASYQNVIKTELSLGGRLRGGFRIKGTRLASTLSALGWALSPRGRRGMRETLSIPRFLVWVGRNWYGVMTEKGRDGARPIETVVE